MAEFTALSKRHNSNLEVLFLKEKSGCYGVGSYRLLKPQYDVNSDTQALRKKKEESRRQYNYGARTLIPLKSGDTVRMKLPRQTIWTPAIVAGEVAPRSYEVTANGSTYRRNRRDLLLTKEQPPPDDQLSMTFDDVELSSNVEPQETESAAEPVSSPRQSTETVPEPVRSPRRSTRIRKVPERFKDYT